MEKLMLAGNHLTSLPIELSACRNLSLLRISANRLECLPQWLLQMPRLSWLAFSGNKFDRAGSTAAIPVIDWRQLNIHKVLGEGASGIIYKASLAAGVEGTEYVAVKVFKGAVTSDGLPDHEMNAFIAAGVHDGLPLLLGQIAHHPEGKMGLVMALIPERFHNLGMPPTFDSCTRDVFRKNLSLPLLHLLKIAITISSVAAQLHSQGIMHGDLYAHNTLVDNEGNTLFGDFGAATLYDIAATDTAAALERIEVSAFGYLLDDLLQLSPEPNTDKTIIQLNKLRDECLAPNVLLRPGFKYLHEALVGL
jgi:serine/threonine protein kinase